MESIKDLKEKRNKLVADARAIQDAAEREGRELTGDDIAIQELALDEAAKIDDAIANRERSDRVASRLSAIAEPKRDGHHLMPKSILPGSGLVTDDSLAIATETIGRYRLANPAALGPRATVGYTRAFGRYLAGDRPEALGLQAAVDSKGGFLTPLSLMNTMIKFLDDFVFMRNISTVLPPMPTAVSLGVPSLEADPGDADWTAEVPASSITQDTSMTFGRREFVPQMLTKLIRVSRKLLRSSPIDMEAFIAQRLAFKFAVTEEKGFLTGTGAQKPLGVFVADANGIPTTRDTTCASQTTFTADEVIDVCYSIAEQYRRNAVWVAHRDWVKRLRKLKDSQNQYLWASGFAGAPDTIMDRPLYTSEFAPNTFTAGKYIAVFGDFKTGYWIGDALSAELQNLGELFALTNEVGLLMRKETDGMPVVASAFGRMILAP